MKAKNKILRRLMKLTFLGRFTMFFYKSMGVHSEWFLVLK